MELINESGFTPEQEQFLQSLETASADETAAVINAYREDVIPEHPDFTASSNIEEPAASQATQSTETPAPDASVTTDQPAPVAEPVKPIDLTVDADKLFSADNHGLVKIDEQLLAKLSEQDKSALQGILGSRLTPQVLKNYISQSRYIEELKTTKHEVTTPAETPEPQAKAEPVKQNLPTVSPELTETRDAVLIAKLQGIPELKDVKTAKELRQTLSDMNFSDPLRAAELINEVQGLKREVDNEVSLMNDFRNNYDKYNTNALDKAIQMIQDASAKNGIDLKEIGLDINEVNETGESKVLKSLLYLPDGTPNPEVVKFGAPGTLVDGIPIISEQDVFNAFLQLATPKALAYTAQKNAELLQQQQRIIAEAKAKGFEEGHKAIANVINSQPVISDGTGVGSQAATINYADITPEQAASLTPTQANKFLELRRAQLG